METEKTLQDQIYLLIKDCFRVPKRGYCWIEPHFDNTPVHAMSESMHRRVIRCLTSKRDQIMCDVHGRIHSAPKL